MKTEKDETVVDMDRTLGKVVKQVMSGKIDCGVANSISNATGKRIGIIRQRLEYAKLRDEKPDIASLNCK
jgi:hypothetical protein